MHKRNTHGIKAAANKKREAAIERTEKAISTLIKEQTAINFNTVSRAANVSTSWLYGEPELCDRIKFLRQQGKSKKQSPKIRASDASKDAMIRTLKDKNKQLRNDVKALKLELERAYGKMLVFEREAKRLQAEANKLRKQLAVHNTVSTKEREVSTASHKEGSPQKVDVEAKIQALGIPMNQSIRKLVKCSSSATVENAIKAFQAQQSPIQNPGGWFRKALTEGWEATEPINPEAPPDTTKWPPELTEWYPKAVTDGFLVDQSINLLPVVSGDVQVKICRPDPFGAPYTVTNWQAAKLEWDAVQGIET